MRMRANPERTLGAALVVEDDDMIAQLLQLILQREGYTPARAWTRRSILSYMADQPPPQLITLDWRLPDVTGLTVLEWVRSTPDWLDIPVLLVTGSSADQSDLTQALAWDRVSYIGKPFSVAELSAAIRRVHTQDTARRTSRAATDAGAPEIEEYTCQP